MVLVVDVIRATTTATALFDEGLEVLVLAESGEAALNLRRGGELLLGEVSGLKPVGFDLGNSPLEISWSAVTGRTAVQATTNGTKAAHQAAQSSNRVLLACLNNAAAASRLAAETASEVVAIVCAGKEGEAGLDDIYTAGALAARLLEAGLTHDGDGAELALTLCRANPDPLPLLTRAQAGVALRRVGLEADIAACAERDVSHKVAVLRARRGTGLVFTAS